MTRAKRLVATARSLQRRFKRLGHRIAMKKAIKLLTLGNMCVYCSGLMRFNEVSIDHRLPLSRGGTNRRENLTLCHNRCNRLKGSLDVAEYAALRLFLHTLPAEAVRDIERRLLAGAAWAFGGAK